MPFIAFLGCDGSGKSAVIEGVAARLIAKGHKVTLGHWRPKPFTSTSNLSYAADNPHGQHLRGLASSLFKLGWLWLNWWVAWRQYLRSDALSGYVIFDRYHGDLLVDPVRYRYGGPRWLACLASRLMPQPDAVIFLDADPEVLLARKKEVAKSALEHSRREYLRFCENKTCCRIIDASQPLDVVISNAEAATKG